MVVAMNELIKRVEDMQSRSTYAATRSGTKGIEDMERVRSETVDLMNEFSEPLSRYRGALEKKQDDIKTQQRQVLDMRKALKEKYNEYNQFSKDKGLKFGCLIYLYFPVYFACCFLYVLVGNLLKYIGLEKIANMLLLSTDYTNNVDIFKNHPISCIIYIGTPLVILVLIGVTRRKNKRVQLEEKNAEIENMEVRIRELEKKCENEAAQVLIEKEKYSKLASYYSQLQTLQMSLDKRIDNEHARLRALAAAEEARARKEEERLRAIAAAEEARERELKKRREEEEQMRLMKALHQREVEIAKEQFDQAVIKARDSAFMKEERFGDLINHTVTLFAEVIDRAGQEKKDEKELVLRLSFVVSKDRVIYDCEYIDERNDDTSFVFRMHDKAELKTREECHGFAWTLMTLVGNEMRVKYPQSTIDNKLVGLTDEEKWAKTEKDPHVWLKYRGYNVHYKEVASMV